MTIPVLLIHSHRGRVQDAGIIHFIRYRSPLPAAGTNGSGGVAAPAEGRGGDSGGRGGGGNEK